MAGLDLSADRSGKTSDAATPVIPIKSPLNRTHISMGIRTIRMDDDTERLLSRIIQTTGLSITAAFKEGLKVFQGELNKTKKGRSLNLVYFPFMASGQ